MENKENNKNGQISFYDEINDGPASNGQGSESGHSSRRRRGRDKYQEELSAFGAPVKAEPRTAAVNHTDVSEESVAEVVTEATAEALESSETVDLESTELSTEDITSESETAETEEHSETQPEENTSDEPNDPPFEETASEASDESAVAEIGFGQIRGFGCEQYKGDEPEDAPTEIEGPSDEAEGDYVISDGIQQKFDITFLEPIVDIEEVEVVDEMPEKQAETADAGVLDEIEKIEMAEASMSTEPDEASDAGVVSEEAEESTNAEEIKETLEPFEKADEPSDDAIVGEVTEAVPTSENDSEAETFEPEPQRERDDIWDEDGREEWEAKEQFLEHCRSLNVPPLRTTKAERVLKRRPPQHSTTSGYQYEEAERLPFDAAEPRTPETEQAYIKREKAYCSRRAKEERRKLRDKASRLLFKAWVMTAVTMVLFGLDCLNFVKRGDGYMLSAETLTAFCCVDTALLVISAALALGIMRDGIASAFRGNHIPETLTAMTVIVTLAYHGALLAVGADDPMIIGSPAALSVLFALIYRYYMVRRDIKTFDNASPYREYTTDVKMKDFPSSPEFSEFDGYAARESELCKINKVSRIDGIYGMEQVKDTCFGMMRVLSIVTACAAIVVALAFGFIKQSLSDGLFYAVLTVAAASPISVFFSMLIPRIKAASAAAEDGSAIVVFDEDGDMLEKSVIMLDDSELFKANTLSPRIEVCKTPDMELKLNRVASLFRRLGGTLGTLFEEAGFTEYEDVTLREIDAHGIYATVGDSDVIAGSESYLSRYGIRVNRFEGESTEDVGVLYIAAGGRFFCRIIMTFKPDLELCKRISELRNTDTLVSLKSCNPCIDTALVYRTTELEPELLKLIKYSSGDDVCPSPTDREGRLVSSKGAVGLFRAVLEYKRQRKRIYYGSRFAIAACIIGAVAAVGMIVGGELTIRLAPVITLALHGVLSLIAAIVAKRKAIDTRTVIKKK